MKKSVITAILILLSFGLGSVHAQSISLSISASAIDSTAPIAIVPVSIDNDLTDSIDVWLDVNGVATSPEKVGAGSGQQVNFSFTVATGSSYSVQAGGIGFQGGSPVIAYSNSESFTAADTTGDVIDTTGPVISNVTYSDVKPHSASISCSSNEPAKIKVYMGESSENYTKTFVDINLSLNPSVNADGLSSNTKHYFKVELEDANGNSTSLGEYDFTTPEVSVYVEIISINNGVVMSGINTNIDLIKLIKYDVGPLSTFSPSTPFEDLLSGSYWLTDTIEGLSGDNYNVVALILIDPISLNEYADTVSVTGIEGMVKERNKFSVYPNPMTDIANITGPSNIEAIFALYNITGQKVMELPIREGKATLQRGDLPKGVYICKIETSEGKPESSRLVIW